MRTGIAHIPLDYGTCPRWLFEKMTRLGRLITESIVYEFGPEEFIRRLSNPFFFQSFGSVLGFDWNSSGLTTTVLGALKHALQGTERDLGIFIAGGKGKTSRKTPEEIEGFGMRYGLDFTLDLVYASKISAKVDSAALQDGFTLYHHTFLFTVSGAWTVVQQGMNTEIKKARRYHWHSAFANGNNFVNEPHSAVCSDVKVKPLNLIAKESSKVRDYSVNLIKENFNSLLKDLKNLDKKKTLGQFSLLDMTPDCQSPPPYLPFDYKKIEKILLETKEKNPQNYEELLGKTKAGPATLRALALVSEIIYGAKPSYCDPVRYSFAHGGKDGYPYPVDREEYEKSISVLEKAVKKAKLGQREKMEAFRKLAQ